MPEIKSKLQFFTMAKGMKTHLFLLDDYRSFTEDVKKKFSDSSRYAIASFQTKDDFLRNFESDNQPKSCKIAILGIHDQTGTADQIISGIRKESPDAGVILLCPPDKIDDIRKNIKFPPDSFILHNGNAILRIHNTVKKLFSEFYMKVYRRRRNHSLAVLAAFIIVAVLAIVIASLKFPHYF